MKLLHLCSYFNTNQLYHDLFLNFDKRNISQIVYVPMKMTASKNTILNKKHNINFIFSKIFCHSDRLLYFKKIKKQWRDLKSKNIKFDEINLIHAHTLFSDGGLAYQLFGEYKIDYILSVRSTDIDIFYKYAIYLRKHIHNILINSKSVVFISHVLKEKLLDKLPFKIRYLVKKNVL